MVSLAADDNPRLPRPHAWVAGWTNLHHRRHPMARTTWLPSAYSGTGGK